MLTGLSDYKGRVHFHIDQLTDQEFDELDQLPSNGDRIEALAGIIDSKIHQNFKLWPNNYIAYDLLHSVNKFKAFYTEEEKKRFIEVMTQKMDKLEGNISLLNNIYLEIYANPVKNQLKCLTDKKKRFACRILILHISYTHYENYSPTDNTHCFLTDDIECTISI